MKMPTKGQRRKDLCDWVKDTETWKRGGVLDLGGRRKKHCRDTERMQSTYTDYQLLTIYYMEVKTTQQIPKDMAGTPPDDCKYLYFVTKDNVRNPVGGIYYIF